MKKVGITGAGLALCLGLSVASANAVTIDLFPASQTVTPGASADVDVVISGLGSFSAPSLGGFDLDLSFDDSVLSFAGVVFGDYLGDVSAFEATAGSGLVPGGVGLVELSFLPPAVLDGIQPGTFTLATVSFDAIALGASAMSISRAELADGLGDPVDATLGSASVRVAAASAPEPGMVLLLIPSLLGLSGSCRSRLWRSVAGRSKRSR